MKLSPVYMDGKGNYKQKEKEVKSLISQYSKASKGNKSKVVSYADVALNGTKHTLHDYSPEIDKNLIIHCYQPEPGYCACVLQVTDQ